MTRAYSPYCDTHSVMSTSSYTVLSKYEDVMCTIMSNQYFTPDCTEVMTMSTVCLMAAFRWVE